MHGERGEIIMDLPDVVIQEFIAAEKELFDKTDYRIVIDNHLIVNNFFQKLGALEAAVIEANAKQKEHGLLSKKVMEEMMEEWEAERLEIAGVRYSQPTTKEN